MSSPSLIHEGVIALVRDNPAFAARVLRDLLHVEVPRFDQAQLTEAALPQLVPVEYHADAVVLFVDFLDDKHQPVFGTIFEVQLERNERKQYTWPLYAVAARARYECPFLLTVVTPDAAVARWAGQPIDLGNGIFVPRVVGPEGVPQVTDPDLAMHEPQLAVLSVVAHGGGEVATAVAIARAAVHAVIPLPDEQRLLYSALIEKALSEAARKALAMESSQIVKFFSDEHRRSYEHGEAKGEARGEAKALVMILKRRGLAITDEQQRQIATCTDLATLDRWLDRALSVSSVDELLARPENHP